MPGKRKKRSQHSSTKVLDMNASNQQSDSKASSDDEQEYEIDHIEGYRLKEKTNQIEFLVRWKGYGQEADTWECFEMFAHDAPGIVQKYLVKEVFQKNKLPKQVQGVQEETKEPLRKQSDKKIIEPSKNSVARIISQFEYGSETKNIGFLVEFTDKETGKQRRELIKEEELLNTHSKEMYQYLFEKKIPLKKSELMSPNFENILDNLNNVGAQKDQIKSSVKPRVNESNMEQQVPLEDLSTITSSQDQSSIKKGKRSRQGSTQPKQ